MTSTTIEHCYCCGSSSIFTNDEGNPREGRCEKCHASKRNSDIAKVLLERVVGALLAKNGLGAAQQQLSAYSILDTQASGPLYEALRSLPRYQTAEYFDNVATGQYQNGVRCEDLMHLTFPANTFDFIITQDVLEHVADPWRAFAEIHRVLKPNGVHVFTVPFHPTEMTRPRAMVAEGQTVNILPQVHHGDPIRSTGIQVFTDFGGDLRERMNSYGFDTQMHVAGEWYAPEEVTWIDTDAKHAAYAHAAGEGKMLSFFRYNSIVFSSRAIKLEFTGERFLPEVRGQIAYEHFHRYAMVEPWVIGKRVLDIASGEGYGSARIASVARSVIGVDISQDAVLHARNTYADIPRLEFRVGGCEQIPVEQGTIDVVVSFETIEHIDDHDRFLAEVKRVLVPDGVFIVSTPNKAVYNEGRAESNQYHVHELLPHEFKDVLARSFAHVQLFGQRLTFSSLVWPLQAQGAATFSHLSEKTSAIRSAEAPFEPEYLIAVCGSNPLSVAAASLYTASDDELLRDYHRRGVWGQSLDRALMEKDVRIRELTRERDLLMQKQSHGFQSTARVASVSPADNLDTVSYRSMAEYRQRWRQDASVMASRTAFEEGILGGEDQIVVEGRCWVCQKDVQFVADFKYAVERDGKRIPNWRERLICPECMLNNRVRAAVHLFEASIANDKSWRVYITEQTTPLYGRLRMRYAQLLGSEYLGTEIPLGSMDGRGIRNEDLTCLTFPSDEFDAVLSFEVLEHVPNYQAALRECLRVLRPGGTLMLSAPFAMGSEDHIVRAVVHEDGTIEHLLPPEYHGDPVNQDGCLAFYHFGWKLLDDLRELGYSDPHVLGVWSKTYGYLGSEQLFFVARKPSTSSSKELSRQESMEITCDARIAEAHVLRENGKIAEAKALLTEVVSRYPGTTEAQNELASLLYASGDKAGARAQLEIAARHSPNDVLILRNLADLLLEAGDYEGTRDTCFRILQNSPDDVDAYFVLGSAMISLKLVARAADYFGRVKRLRPEYPHIDSILASLPGQAGKGIHR